MKLFCSLTVIVLMTCAITMAQAWEHVYPNGAFSRIAYSAHNHYDNGIILGINEYNSNLSSTRIVLTKIDEDGNIIWEKTIGNFNEGIGVLNIIVRNKDLFVTGVGYKFDSEGCSFISKYNSCFERCFTSEYGLQNDLDYALKILPSLDSNLFLEIQYYGIDTAQNPERATMLKLTPNGDVIWQTNFTPAAFGVDFDNMILTNDSGLLAISTGYLPDSGTASPSFVRTIATKIDKNGIIEWSNAYGLSNFYYTHGKSAIQTKDNGYLLLSRWATLWKAIRTWNYLIKIDSLGNEEWRKFISDTTELSEYPNEILWLNDSELVATASVSNNTDIQTIIDRRIKIYKIDTLGIIIDSNTVGSNWQLAGQSILTKDTNIMVCGMRAPNGVNRQAFALKIRTSDLQLDTMKNQNLTYDYLCPSIITSGYIPYDTAATSIGFAEEEQTAVHFMLYPNPASAVLYISPGEPIHKATQLTAHVYNLFGEVVAEILLKPHQSQISIDVSHYAAGAYILTVTQQGNVVYKNRFMVVK